MKTLDDERFVLENFNMVKLYETIFFGNFFRCLTVYLSVKRVLKSKSWVDSSAKNLPPPDFHNDKFKIMMDVMRIDDSIQTINDKHVKSSFEKTNKNLEQIFGCGYKKNDDNIGVWFIPNTRNSNEFNFEGYFNNFKRVLLKHSKKLSSYHKNYPKCKTTILFICDESNNYIQVLKEEDLKKENEENVYIENFRIHICYIDKKFLDVIKETDADYIIWFGYFKCIYTNGKREHYPRICVYDVKHFHEQGIDYDHSLMFKVTEEVKEK